MRPIVQELGGAETGPRAAYVEAVGRRVGAYSGVANAGQALHFTTLNSAVENAFSVPGGYVYVTRQLMGLMDDEFELAFALGSRGRPHRRQPRPYPRAICAAAARSACSGRSSARSSAVVISNVLQSRARLDTLSFSREQEYQADTLGLRYMMAAGYDPAGACAAARRAQPRNARSKRACRAGPTARRPEWASTHPLSENRMQRALAGGAGNRPARHRGPQPRPVSLASSRASTSTTIRRRASSTARPSRIPDLRIQFTRAAGLSDVQRHGRGDDFRLGGEGAVQRRPPTAGSLDEYISRVFAAADARQAQIPGPAAAAPDHQRHAGRGHDGARQDRVGRDRRQRRRLSMGRAAHLSFRDADAGRLRGRAVRADDQFAAPDHARRKRRRSGRGSSTS